MSYFHCDPLSELEDKGMSRMQSNKTDSQYILVFEIPYPFEESTEAATGGVL